MKNIVHFIALYQMSRELPQLQVFLCSQRRVLIFNHTISVRIPRVQLEFGAIVWTQTFHTLSMPIYSLGTPWRHNGCRLSVWASLVMYLKKSIAENQRVKVCASCRGAFGFTKVYEYALVLCHFCLYLFFVWASWTFCPRTFGTTAPNKVTSIRSRPLEAVLRYPGYGLGEIGVRGLWWDSEDLVAIQLWEVISSDTRYGVCAVLRLSIFFPLKVRFELSTMNLPCSATHGSAALSSLSRSFRLSLVSSVTPWGLGASLE